MDSIVVIIMGLTGGYRALAIHNYLRLKRGEKKEGLFSFIDNNPIGNLGGKLFLLTILREKSDILEVEDLRKKINIATYIMYLLIVLLIIAFVFNI